MGVLELLLARSHNVVVLGLIAFFVGPMLLSGFLMWRLAIRQDDSIDQIRRILDAHVRAMQDMVITATDIRMHDLDYQRAMVRLSAETCKQQANSNAVARLCDEIARPWIER